MSSQHRPVVTVNLGQIQGLERETKNGKKIHSFKGIPFAEPPIGDLRFKNPEPLSKPWTGILDASKEGNNCPQISLLKKFAYVGDEDSLYLNVYTPANSDGKTEKYPVIFYIHGGGLAVGSGDEAEYGPESLVENGVIVVAANYRLGIFGFLCLDIPEAPGNMGLKDQLLAIQWVKDNIHHFNGDSENITLHGISAGSASIEFQLLRSKSRGLFHKAIMNSGSVLTGWARPRSTQNVLTKFASFLGVDNEPYAILNKLHTMSGEEIALAAFKARDTDLLKAGYLFTQFIPVVEKTFPNVENFLTKDPHDVYKNGEFLKIPTITSFCRDEGNMFPMYMDENCNKTLANREYAEFMTFLNIKDKGAVNKKLLSLYESMKIDETTQIHEFLSDLFFLAGIYESMKHLAKDEHNKHFVYMFDYCSPNKMFAEIGIELPPGIPHAIDMAYVVSSFYYSECATPKDKSVKEFMTRNIISFVKHSDPSISGCKIWKPTTEEDFKVLDIRGDEDECQMIDYPFEDRMKYWNSLY